MKELSLWATLFYWQGTKRIASHTRSMYGSSYFLIRIRTQSILPNLLAILPDLVRISIIYLFLHIITKVQVKELAPI